MKQKLREIIDFLDCNLKDPIAQYILQKEIICDGKEKHIDLKQSKWYQQLSQEQWDNGSWGRFHTQDTKLGRKQKFPTTEAALTRFKDLSLDQKDDIVKKTIQLMERYLMGKDSWPDTKEHHYGWNIAFKTLIAADLSLFLPDHPYVLDKKRNCAEVLKKSIVNGSFYEDIWEKECLRINDILLHPYMVYPVWLLQNNNYIDKKSERIYFEYIWNRTDGIYYRTNGPASKVEYLESKKFTQWLTGLENLSSFSIFPEFMALGNTDHLFLEIQRLLNDGVKLPADANVIGHYSESWSGKNARKNDLVLRITRVLVKALER